MARRKLFERSNDEEQREGGEREGFNEKTFILRNKSAHFMRLRTGIGTRPVLAARYRSIRRARVDAWRLLSPDDTEQSRRSEVGVRIGKRRNERDELGRKPQRTLLAHMSP